MTDLITNGGKGVWTAAVVAAAAPPKFVYWGTGSGQTATSTDLATKAGPTTVTAVTGTIVTATTTTTNDTVQVDGTVTADATRAITEVGTTTNATIASGTLTQYGDFSVINLLIGDSIAFTLKTKTS